jgi:hypothetical protein
MGGLGSGQWRSRGARRVDRFSSISINDLRQRRLLSAGELRYCSHNEQDAGEGVVERIQFGYTCTNFGGRRAWFLCPGCGRRCGKLYAAQLFRCRLCLRLVYRSQYESLVNRAFDNSRRIRLRLGGSVDVTQPLPPRPKRMRRTTYERLSKKVNAADRVWRSWGSKHFGVPESYL